MDRRFVDTTGKRVRLLMEDLELTNKSVIAELGQYEIELSSGYLSDIKNKGKLPSAKVLAALAQVLGTTTDYLLLLTDDPELPEGSRDDVVYLTDDADPNVVQRLIDVFVALSRADQDIVIRMAEGLRAVETPRIIGNEEEH